MNQDWQAKERLPSPISSVDFGPGQAWSGSLRAETQSLIGHLLFDASDWPRPPSTNETTTR